MNPDKPLNEALLERTITIIEGPMNRTAEKLLKNRFLLMPLGLGWTAWCRSVLALREGSPSRLWRSSGEAIPGTQAHARQAHKESQR